jgi:hypothetical protein
MSKLYIYKIETREIVDEKEGDRKEIEEAAAAEYDTDVYAWTYTPAFGTKEGLYY